MEFVTAIHKLAASVYPEILVIVNRLTKMAIYIRSRKIINSTERP
jgi:hypothetical protein